MKYVFAKIILIYALSMGTAKAKSISFSFDDLPRKDSYLTGDERGKKIRKALKSHGVIAVFYVNTHGVGKKQLARIRDYAKAGHIIGNHTHSHPSADLILPEVFVADFKAADNLLKFWGFSPAFFRYPYLHRGVSLKEISQIREVIHKAGYQDGFVTIDNYDWYIDRQFQKAKTSCKAVNMERLRAYYVETLTKGIEHYENLAKKVYGRSPNHVMLLHENDMAALFLGDLLKFLKKKGWRFCHPRESYTDTDLIPFPDKITRHGQGRVVAHATAKGFAKPLISGYEDEKVLDQLWKKYQVSNYTNSSLKGQTFR